jgi:hypothetical protein
MLFNPVNFVPQGSLLSRLMLGAGGRGPGGGRGKGQAGASRLASSALGRSSLAMGSNPFER